MKRTLLAVAIAIASGSIPAAASEMALKISLLDGTESTWLLSKKPVITFAGQDMKISVGSEPSLIKRSDVASMKFTDDVNGQKPVILDKEGRIVYNGSHIMAQGKIEVYSLDGRLAAASVDTLIADTLAAGIYIVRAANNSIKIVIR